MNKHTCLPSSPDLSESVTELVLPSFMLCSVGFSVTEPSVSSSEDDDSSSLSLDDSGR